MSRRVEGGRSQSSKVALLPRIRMSDVSRLTPELQRFGRDKNPVLVVDDFLANPDEVRQCALQSRFCAGSYLRYYPGYQADCGLRGIDEVVSWVAATMWRDAFGRKVAEPS